MPTLGSTEVLVILLIVVVVFGASRVGDLIGGIGRGIRQFRTEVREDGHSKGSSSGESAS
ncbi:MAG: twin-arginine translocase TatA/TatE family subunit [Chloroflexi bacterium]|nr:twin-arginine translocase TatA/TatE family subunit [Chloroflexota bacterium]